LWLRGGYDDGQPLWLIRDCCNVHHQEELKHYAAKLVINLLFIPLGLTDEFQILDRFMFGAMKSNWRRTYRVHITEFGKMSKQIAAGFLVRTWKAVSAEVRDEAWSIYGDFNGPGD
jgi:hypothetical protein